PLTVGPTAIEVATGGMPVAGTTTLSNDRLMVTFTPAAPFARSTSFAATVAGLADVAGNSLTPVSTSFTTGTTSAGGNSLSVSAVSPAHGSIEVTVDTAVHVTFTAAVDPTTVALNTMLLYVPGVGNLAATYQVNGA